MVDNIILFLMQIKGMSRKTLYKYFQFVEPGEYSLGDVQLLIKEAALNTGKINIPSLSELNNVYEKYEKILYCSEDLGIQITSYLDKQFPVKLRNIDDPPAIIYTLGDLSCMDKSAVAVIGTREPIEYGAKIADNLGYVLGRDGYTVVSGLAYGCDKFGHEGCLRSGGKTVAVMAGGLDKVYPARHKELAKAIVESGGCLMSEYPVNTRTFQSNFVERDRLQSGLSEGIIVVETDLKGGTWHTIEFAKKNQRSVGCYVHPDKYLMEKKTFGNQKLLKEDGVFGIKTNDDLNIYKQLIDEKHLELIKTTTEIKAVQTSFIGQIGG